MKKDTRFELEQQLIDCWGVCDDLETIFAGTYEQDVIDKDKLANMLLGMKELYQLKFEKCFATFETLINEKY